MAARESARERTDAESRELADVLAHATFVTMGLLSKVAADSDLSLTQLRLLGILRDRRVSMSALASYLGLDRSSLTGLVDRASLRGLLARLPDENDKRGVQVALTPAGHRFAATLEERVEADLTALTGKLSPADRRRLQSLLAKLLD
jgi:DNA-binding MarR family transcriptional regulator